MFLFFLGADCFAELDKKEYFQQKVDYRINVTLDDQHHLLTGNIRIDYINKSPDTLYFIYFHLWPNAYKDNSTGLARQFRVEGKTTFAKARLSDRGFIDSLDFRSNENKLKLEFDTENIDIAKLILNYPLLPGENIILESPFKVKLPNAKFSRLGHIGQSYMITQWYPKPAVYDRQGWHQMPYLNQGEFYSEFGSFDVSITLPRNYVVGSTGVLQNNDLENEWMTSLSDKTKALPEFSTDLSFPPSDPEYKTLNFKQDYIHDFAWFADKRFNVLEHEIELSDSKRKVKTRALFTNDKASLWMKSPDYLGRAIFYYSLWNGEYPYDEVTAVDGTISAGGGMEYPMITIIGKPANAHVLEQTIVHEVGHNWFYGILGTNERTYPWMDEGINSFNEMRYFETINKDKDKTDLKKIRGIKGFITMFGKSGLYGREVNELIYQFTAREANDQGLQLASSDYRSLNYGAEVYVKSALVFDYLKTYLGEELFDSIMHEYYQTWKFKHPYPADLKSLFEIRSEQDLSWFFDELLKTDRKLDYGVKHIKKLDDHKSLITLKNKGDINGPVVVELQKENKLVERKWIQGFDHTYEFETMSDFDEVHLDHDHRMPEYNRNDNVMRSRGILRKVETPRIDFLAGLDDEHYTNIFVVPFCGKNVNDGFMPGLAIYSTPIPSRPFRYAIAPMYGLAGESATGTGFIQYKKLSKVLPFHSVDLALRVNKFGYESSPFKLSYFKINPEITFELVNDRKQESITNQIQLRGFYLNKEIAIFDRNEFRYDKETTQDIFSELIFIRKKGTKNSPFKNTIKLQQGPSFLKLQVEINKTFSFPTKPRGLQVRIFAGTFILDEGAGPYRFRMSSWSGHQDYLFEHIYPGRNENEGVFSRQLSIEDGGFKVPTPVGQSDKWLVALNLKMALPGNLPFSLFADIGTYNNASKAFTGSEQFMYDAGVMASIIPDILEIYLPLWVSSDIANAADITNFKFRRIQFVLKIKDLNPLNIAKNLVN